MDIFMDGKLALSLASDCNSKDWVSTTGLALMEFAYLGKPYSFGLSSTENDRRTTKSQYHSFTVHEGYKGLTAVSEMLDQGLLDELNGPHSIVLDVVYLEVGNPEVAANYEIATISAQGVAPLTFDFASGDGDDDNGDFAITGNKLKVGGTALTDGDYAIRIKLTDNNGTSIEKAFTITVLAAVGALPEPELQFTFDDVDDDGVSVSAAVGGVTGELINGAEIVTENGKSVLYIGKGYVDSGQPGYEDGYTQANSPYFDMSIDAADIINNANAYTISTYFKKESGTYTDRMTVWTFVATIFDGNPATDRSLTALSAISSNIQLQVTSTAIARQNQNMNTPLPTPGGDWAHLMVTHDGTDMNVWVNGVLIGPLTTASKPNSTNITKLELAWLGRRWDGSGTTGGPKYMEYAKYHDFRIYTEALTAAQIAKLKFVEITETLAILNAEE
jgi:hypothetical protein